MLETLKSQVLEANLELVRRGLVLYTFGNASGIDRELGLVAIKPSGVPYESLTADDMVVSDLQGKIVGSRLKPSSDLDTHLELYRAFPMIGGVVHTHSEFATAWAQAGREIPAYGTTHADYFYGPVPLTEELSAEEVGCDYVLNTGKAIVRRFRGSRSCSRAWGAGSRTRAVCLGEGRDGSRVSCGGAGSRGADGVLHGDPQPGRGGHFAGIAGSASFP